MEGSWPNGRKIVITWPSNSLDVHDSCYETVEHYLLNDDFPLLPLFRLGAGRTKQNTAVAVAGPC